MFCEAEQLLQREGSQSHAQLAELLQGSFSLLCDVKERWRGRVLPAE